MADDRELLQRLEWAHATTHALDMAALFREVLASDNPLDRLRRLTAASPVTRPPADPDNEGLAGVSFQHRVGVWAETCFPPRVVYDRLERRDRLVEEALELAQTLPDFTADRAHALVDYVFSRPVGVTEQESGGVSVTHAALCHAEGIDQQHWAEVELARINQPAVIEKIRAKQAAKPTGSALPIAALATAPRATEAEQIADTPGAGLISDEDGLRELRLLYNYAEDDSRQFTRWQMLVAMSHGRGLATEADAARAEVERLRNLLHLADETLMLAIGHFPLDAGPLRDGCLAIRAETGGDYEERKRRARTTLSDGASNVDRG